MNRKKDQSVISRLRKVLDPGRTGKDAESLEKTLLKLIVGQDDQWPERASGIATDLKYPLCQSVLSTGGHANSRLTVLGAINPERDEFVEE